MAVNREICKLCGFPFEEGEEKISDSSGTYHTRSITCVKMLKSRLQTFVDEVVEAAAVTEASHDFVILTREESLRIGGVLGNYISEMGSIFNDPKRLKEENQLRKKFGLVPWVPKVTPTGRTPTSPEIQNIPLPKRNNEDNSGPGWA